MFPSFSPYIQTCRVPYHGAQDVPSLPSHQGAIDTTGEEFNRHISTFHQNRILPTHVILSGQLGRLRMMAAVKTTQSPNIVMVHRNVHYPHLLSCWILETINADLISRCFLQNWASFLFVQYSVVTLFLFVYQTKVICFDGLLFFNS